MYFFYVSSASFACEARFHHNLCPLPFKIGAGHHENLRTYIYLNNDYRVSSRPAAKAGRVSCLHSRPIQVLKARVRTKCVASSYYTGLLTVSGEPYAVKVARTVRWERGGRPSYGSVINYSRPNLLITIIVPLALTSN
jgi:hypothetical protein